MMRIAIVGLGAIARYYNAAVAKNPQTTLTAVCDIDPTKQHEWRGQSRAWYFDDYGAMLRLEGVDAVIVTTPNDSHYELAAAALRAGKHVCCEKPLTTNIDDARELLDIARQQQRTMFTAFHRRYNRHLRRHAAELGDRAAIASVSTNYLEMIQQHAGADSWYLDPHRCGGGCIADNGPNVFDTLSSFLGRLEVVSVETVRASGIDIRADLRLVSEEGTPIDAHMDWQYAGEKKDLSVVFADGRTIYIDLLQGFNEFKGSLWHEYEGILDAFLVEIERGAYDERAGYDAVRLVKAAYEKERQNDTAGQA